jgi:hypothetical protein
MMLRNPFKLGSSIAIFIILLLGSVLTFSPDTVPKVIAQQEYDYYGYVPAKIYNYNLTDQNNLTSGWRLDTRSVSKAGLIVVTGIEDNTHVKVYCLTNGSLLSEATIDSIENHCVMLKNGTFFKVVTDKLANVMLLNIISADEAKYTPLPANWNTLYTLPLPFTFFYDVNGAYVGKEFILMAIQINIYRQYTIFALEKATVTVTRDDGDVQTSTIEANSWNRYIWEPFMTYKIESTGNIMIHCGNIGATTFFVPCTEGGFVGEHFFTPSITTWDTVESCGYRVSATQDTKITVWDLTTKQQMFTANVPGGSGYGFKPKAQDKSSSLSSSIFVESDHPVTLIMIHNGSIERAANSGPTQGIHGAYGSGVGYFGVKPDEDTPFYLPVDSYVEAYIFASEDTEVTIDENPWTIGANSYYMFSQPGTHIIRANKNVVVETLNWPDTPEYQGLQYSGVQVPCVQTVDIVTNVTLTPLGEGLPIMYIVIGAAAAAIGVIAALLFMKSRGKK